jgi:hypothetical protein
LFLPNNEGLAFVEMFTNGQRGIYLSSFIEQEQLENHKLTSRGQAAA